MSLLRGARHSPTRPLVRRRKSAVTGALALSAVFVMAVWVMPAQAQQAPRNTNAPSAGAVNPAEADLKNLTLKQACPESDPKRPGNIGSGLDSVERAKKLVEIMKTCTGRLKLAFQENPNANANTVNESLEQLIQASQARVNELLSKGGLVEDVNLYIDRLNGQLKDIPLHFLRPEDRDRESQETKKLIEEANSALQGLVRASKGFNESVIFLESKRPEIAFKLSLAEAKKNVEGLRDAIALIDHTTIMFNDIGRDLGARSPN